MPETENLATILLKHALRMTNEGYGEYAAEVAFYASAILREGEELPSEAKLYLADALEQISIGIPPNEALKLNGRKSLEVREVEWLMAKTIYRANKSGHKLEYLYEFFAENGFPIGNRKIMYRSKPVIKAAYNKHKKSRSREANE